MFRARATAGVNGRMFLVSLFFDADGWFNLDRQLSRCSPADRAAAMRSMTKGVVLTAITIAVLAGISGCDSGGRPVPPVMPSSVTPSSPSVPPNRVFLFVTVLHTPCSGCLVEITAGPGAGRSATTAHGEATLEIPQREAVTLRASKKGYRPATTTVSVTGSLVTLNLESEGPTIDLAGARLLEIRADVACDQLPAALRVRRYPVSLVKETSRFRVYPVDDVFTDFLMAVGASVDEAFFVIENWDNEQDGIIERLPAGGALRIQLWTYLVPVANPDAISTPIEGTISYCDTASSCIAVCESQTHQLTLTRR